MVLTLGGKELRFTDDLRHAFRVRGWYVSEPGAEQSPTVQSVCLLGPYQGPQSVYHPQVIKPLKA